MNRRDFIALMAAASSCAWPFAALAQVPTKRPRITYIGGSGPTPSAKVTGAFIEGMRALGYTEGRDFEIEYRGPKATWSVCLRSLRNRCDAEAT